MNNKINRTYRDRLFKFIFGNPANVQWTISLYNAINGTHYDEGCNIEINTIDDVLYMSMKNDVSFLIGDTVNFYEQQSTFNPNMPIRFLMYAGMVYSKYIQDNSVYLYSGKIQHLPIPKCICFYNGPDALEESRTLYLSDAFEIEKPSDIQVTVTMLNVNFGHNRELMESCEPLMDYSWFVGKICEFGKTMRPDDAVEAALDEMPNSFVIKPFLLAHKAEVTEMCITEYNEEKALAAAKAESKAEGRAEGRAEGETKGKIEAFAEMVRDHILTFADAAKRVGMSVPDFETATGLKAADYN